MTKGSRIGGNGKSKASRKNPSSSLHVSRSRHLTSTSLHRNIGSFIDASSRPTTYVAVTTEAIQAHEGKQARVSLEESHMHMGQVPITLPCPRYQAYRAGSPSAGSSNENSRRTKHPSRVQVLPDHTHPHISSKVDEYRDMSSVQAEPEHERYVHAQEEVGDLWYWDTSTKEGNATAWGSDLAGVGSIFDAMVDPVGDLAERMFVHANLK